VVLVVLDDVEVDLVVLNYKKCNKIHFLFSLFINLKNMNTKIIIIIIIFFSFISWILWSYFFINILLNSNNNINSNQNEIIKNQKIINITDIESEITKLVKNTSPSVVSIVIKKDIDMFRSDPWWFFEERVWSVEKKVWWWSGFFVSKDWIIMTNKHVVWDQNAKYSVITNDWKEYDAIVLALDPLTDLAIIKINWENNFPVLNAIEDEKYIKIWQFVIAIWNALAEFQNSVSFWVISWKWRNIEAWNNWYSEKLVWLLQTDARINPWNSWWPLIDLNWEIVWINTAIAWNSQWLGFSIPLSKKRVEYILSSINKYWSIKRPFIWINYIPLNLSISKEIWLDLEYWAYIPEKEDVIAKWSIAEKSWIKWWDIILEIDWVKIDINNNIADLIQNKIPWDKIKLKILTKEKIEKIMFLELWEY